MDKNLVFGDPKAPRFVYWEKKLRPTPSGPDALTFNLVTFPGKIRIGLGALGLKKGMPSEFTPFNERFTKKMCPLRLSSTA